MRTRLRTCFELRIKLEGKCYLSRDFLLAKKIDINAEKSSKNNDVTLC